MTTGSDVVRGVRNNNPGNIERVKGVRWQGELPLPEQERRDKRFVVFSDPVWGIRAIARTLITYQDQRFARDGSKIDTIREIIERWAPSGENNTEAYIQDVSRLSGIKPNDPIDVYKWATMRPIVKAIISHECAGYQYPDDVVDNALNKAGLRPPEMVTAHGTDTTAAVGVAAAVVSGVVAALPAAHETYDMVKEQAGFLSEIAPWLPTALAGVAVVSVLILAARARHLSARLK